MRATRIRRLTGLRPGEVGELVAALAYVGRGHRVLARRLRTPAAEIDLVCRRGHTLVIVEVKSRAERDLTVAELVTPAQAARLVRAARDLRAVAPWVRTVRIDLCVVHRHRARILRNAIAERSTASGHRAAP